MTAIGILDQFEGPVPRSVYAESVRLAELLIKAASRARRGTESLAIALTLDEAPLPGMARKSGAWSPWMVLLGDGLRSLLRPEDELVQVDRKEFVLILEGTQAENARAVVRRIRSGVRRLTATARESGPTPTLRIGVVPVTGTQTPDDLLTSLEASRARAA